MKKLLFFLITTLTATFGFTQNFQWAKTLGGSDRDFGYSIALDKQNNVYTIGTFSATTADFDPGPNTYNLTPHSLSTDIFISKLDANGNFVWAKKLGGPSDDIGTFITVDKNYNIYVTGTFGSTVDFDPGPGISEMTATPGGLDAFIAKLDSAGNLIWAKKAGGTANDGGLAISVDSIGKVYVTGSFWNTADFDPGPNTYNLISAGSDDIFIWKLDENGNFLWANKFGGTSDDKGYSICVDKSGNVYTTGYFLGTVDFDPGPATFNLVSSVQGDDIFILKLDSSGNFKWAKKFGAGIGYFLRADVLGNVYTTGNFIGTVDFDPGPNIYNLTSSTANNPDCFLSKLDSLGNFIWAKKIGGIGQDNGNAFTLDKNANIYLTGDFSETADFDPSANTANLSPIGWSDIFVAKYDSSGNYKWAKSMGYTTLDNGMGIAIDSTNNLYITGCYGGTVDFDPNTSVYNLTANGWWDAYVLKLTGQSLPVNLLNFQVTKNRNDALLAWQTASEINTYQFEIEKSKDGFSFKKIGETKAIGNSTNIISYQFVDFNAGLSSTFPIAYYRFKQVDVDGKFTYSPIKSIKFDDKPFELHVYPNPATSSITIQPISVDGNSSFFITDLTGKRILQGTFTNGGSQTVNIGSLAKGFYFVHTSNNEKEAVKFEKQ